MDSLYTFFNSADESNSYNLDYPAFEKSLIYNILFQDKIVLPDVYYQQSTFLFKHYLQATKKNKSSLFIEATNKGIIIPALRSKENKTLFSTISHIKNPDVKGNHANNIHNYKSDESETSMLNNLLLSIDEGLDDSKTNPIFWADRSPENDPLSSQKGYMREIWENLYNKEETPSFISESVKTKMEREAIWVYTKPWRSKEIFNEASDITKDLSGGIGLRRSELFRAIARRVLGEENKNGLNLNFLLKEGNFKNKREKDALIIFWSWMNQCYHINMANQLQSRVNLPKYNIFTDFTAQNQFLKNASIKEDINRIKIPVRLCSMKSLKKIEPKEIVSIRETWGKDYRMCLKEYSSNPNQNNRVLLEKALKKYCETISVKSGGSSKLVEVIVQTLGSQVLKMGVDGLMKVFEIENSEIQTFVDVMGNVAVSIPFVNHIKNQIKLQPKKTEISFDFIKPL